MYHEATDAELVQMGKCCGSRNLRIYADRIEHRAAQAESARVKLREVMRNVQQDEVFERLREIARLIDWRYEIPGRPDTTEKLRKQHQVQEV